MSVAEQQQDASTLQGALERGGPPVQQQPSTSAQYQAQRNAPAQRSAPAPWAGRVRAPDNLDLATDRGESFHVWKESWEDYVLLTGLADAEPNIQLAALKNSMTPESRRVLRNLDLSEAQRAGPEAVMTALERFATGQINEVIERKNSMKGCWLRGNSLMIFDRPS